MRPDAGKLIVVSNRTAVDPKARAGGLAVAMWDALVETKGMWIGWSGQIYDFPSRKVKTVKDDGVEFALSDMTKQQYEGFYLGFSNSVLWPVLHNRLDLAVFDHSDFPAYREINRNFARIVRARAEPEDFVWVQDYHFFLLASELRKRQWSGQVGFFLHVPFPAPEVFRAIPEHAELARALCDYDIIGLQTRKDIENFKSFLSAECDAKIVGGEKVEAFGRTITLRHCPIGIDGPGFANEVHSEAAKQAADRISRFLGQRQLIIGVDRMDYSKGLPQRFAAVGRMFDLYPETRGRTTFTHIAPPSRSVVDEYVHLRENLDQLSGRINGDYGDLDWIPLRYLVRGYSRQELAGLYNIARVGLVTPLQDGMNLVAKEYVAAQNPMDPGVLVLSEFAGAAEQMDQALIVNPHDTSGVAAAIKRGLDMTLEERKERWRALYDGVCQEDISWWRRRFLKDILPSRQPNGVTELTDA
jgi:trehalose 6-phosphate synthase